MFDNVWHKGIIFEGKLVNVLSDFLKDRKQRVNSNGKVSSWTSVNAGVPLGSVLGPFFFGLYQRSR